MASFLGTVKRFDGNSFRGYMTPDGGGNDLLFYFEPTKNPAFIAPKAGERYSFDITTAGKAGTIATNLSATDIPKPTT